nr:efflux RND transporter periplasmic adaptor subunit [Pyxidicoccus fallax]
MEALGPPPEAVGSAVAQADTWERTLQAVGTVTSIESVAIRNEVPGVVERIAFSSGARAQEGAVLFELDARIERAQLRTARARLADAQADLHRARALQKGGVLTPSALDDAEAAYNIAAGEVSALEARLHQKIIRAPFTGRLGIRNVSVGQFLNPGTQLVVLDAVDDLLVDFSLPQQDVSRVQSGMPVRVGFSASPRTELAAKLLAVEPTVDVATRNLALRARVTQPDGRLKPGMFVDVTVVTPEKLDVVTVPATSVVHAAYGDSVFVIEEKKPGTPGMDRTPDGKPVHIARQQFVRLGSARGDFVSILQGLEPGARVVTAGAFKLRNGTPVVVDDSAMPRPERDPKPENR